jgi:hypothetical protein
VIEIGGLVKGQQDGYHIEAEHARGGFGITYRGRRASNGQTVIVKALRLDRMGDWKVLELFEREAKVLRGLSHPGIPRFIDHFALGDAQAPAGFVLVQEFVPGSNLREIMRQGPTLGQLEMLAWFQEILEILAYLHGLSPPVVHRDVTPKNIIVRPDGRAVLVDFGSVQAVLRTGQSVSSTAAGTFGYAPMEQFVGRAVPASDLYGLGMTFLAVASGREPEALPMDGVRANVRAVLLRDARFDARLATLIERMTEPDPRRRLPDASTALQHLAVALGRTPATEPALASPSAMAGIVGAARVTDPESYLGLLASRLLREGFTVHHGGRLGETPLALHAERRGGTLKAADSFHIYAAVADQLEGQPGPDEGVSAEQLAAFANAAQTPHAAGSDMVSRLVSGRTIVVPIIISQGGAAPRLQAKAAPLLVGHDGLAAVPVVVDLEHTAVHVVPPPGALGDDAEGVLPYLWWLGNPRVIDRPKRKARRSPVVRIALGLLVGVVLLVGAGWGYMAAAPSGENYLVYAADVDLHRLAVKRFFVKSSLLGTEVVEIASAPNTSAGASLPGNAYLCALAADQVTYFVQDKAANAVTYWQAGWKGNGRRELTRTEYSHWWSCAVQGERVAYATGNPNQEGLVMLARAGGKAEPANGSELGDKFPAWFPDGKRLAVSAGKWGRERLVQIDLGSGQRTTLTADADAGRGAEARPAISPDGGRVAFYRTGRRTIGDEVRRPSSDVYDLYVLDLASQRQRLVVQEVCFVTSAAWLANDELVYGKWSKGECAAFLYDLKGDVARLLPADF